MLSQVLCLLGGPGAEGVFPNSRKKSLGAANPGPGTDAWEQGL